jgi:hypothetical protein
VSDDWQERLLENYRTARKRRGFSDGIFRRDQRPLQFTCTLEFIAFTRRAAKAMGVNHSTFVRRALAVAAAAVLGEDVKDILYHSPCPKPWEPTKGVFSPGAGERDTGEGIRDWCTHPHCDGEHLVR